jgi:hypothetical protein
MIDPKEPSSDPPAERMVDPSLPRPVLPLEYRAPDQQAIVGWPHLYVLGLAGGTVLSFLVYKSSFHEGILLLAGFTMLLLKFFFSIGLIMFAPRWRRLGLGLLTSLPLGFLIFFGICAGRI